MDAIGIKGLTKKYKEVVAVDNLSLSVHKGELFALLGVNGAGKTTTIKMLSCIAKPTSGDAFLNGKSVCRDIADVKTIIAVSPQETAVANGLTVRENLEFIWDRYFKENKVHKRAVVGTGLGLSIVKGILQMHNAKFGVETSEAPENHGSTFWFELECSDLPAEME